jgi:allophanate hydrolase subunit 2
VRAGELLPAKEGSIPTRHLLDLEWIPPTVEPFHMIPGPDRPIDSELDAAFSKDCRFRVGTRSDRMGLRLEGDPVPFDTTAERLSAPTAPGAVQVAGGQLIILGIACGTMGGYSHVAHVISADLDRLGQLKPGDEIGFRRVSLEAARQCDSAARQARKRFLTRVVIAVQDQVNH